MNLHTHQHLSLSDLTWSNTSVTHCTLCPSVKEEQNTLHGAFVREAGSPWRLGDPLSPWQPAPSCLHSIYSPPVPAPLPAVRVPTCFLSIACGEPWDEKSVCWTSVGLRRVSDIQRPAVLHSIPKVSSQWMKWMKCKPCFMSFFYVVTSGCTGVLGAAGMGDVCTWLSHAEALHLGSTWQGEESLFRDTPDLGLEEV